MSAEAIACKVEACSPLIEISAPSAISRMAVNAATVNDAIRARKKFMAPVAVPICARATAFWIETTLTGKTVPRPSANTDNSASSDHSGIGVAIISPHAVSAETQLPAIATRF